MYIAGLRHFAGSGMSRYGGGSSSGGGGGYRNATGQSQTERPAQARPETGRIARDAPPFVTA